MHTYAHIYVCACVRDMKTICKFNGHARIIYHPISFYFCGSAYKNPPKYVIFYILDRKRKGNMLLCLVKT